MNTKNLNSNVTDYYSSGKRWVRRKRENDFQWQSEQNAQQNASLGFDSSRLKYHLEYHSRVHLIIHPPLSMSRQERRLWRNNDLFKFNANVTKYMLLLLLPSLLFPTEIAILFNETNFRRGVSLLFQKVFTAFFSQSFISFWLTFSYAKSHDLWNREFFSFYNIWWTFCDH
jgi:hypothetical protein